MDDYEKVLVEDILESPNTYEKIKKFENYRNDIKDCRIFLFDEECSNFGSSFKNQQIGKCGIYGVGDYTKTWLLDSQHTSSRTYIQAGKTLDLDLNILTYLNRVMHGWKINIGEEEFFSYLSYVKENKFQCGITTALMERVKTPVDLNILSEMLISYVKFDTISVIDKDSMGDIYLSSDKYLRAKQIYDMTVGQGNESVRQFDVICCHVMKAFLIKNYSKNLSKEEKIEHFIDFCVNTLQCYLEKEIVLLSLYIAEDERTHATFKKLKNDSNIIKNISNVTWDIFHIRLIEQMLLYDNCNHSNQIILSYFATADKGVIDAMQINPIKAFVIKGNYCIPYHTLRMENICNNNDILDEVKRNSSLRAIKVQTVDFEHMSHQLAQEIIDRQNKAEDV